MEWGNLKGQNSVNSQISLCLYNNYLHYFLILYSLTFLCVSPPLHQPNHFSCFQSRYFGDPSVFLVELSR